MKLKIYLINFCLFISSAFADDIKMPEIKYPTLPETGKDISAFMPNEWLIEKIVYGDLNNNGDDDIALVLRYVGINLDNVVILNNDVEDKFDITPRILAVLFKEKTGYRLGVQSNSIIPPLDPNARSLKP